MKKFTVLMTLAIACSQLSLNAQFAYSPNELRRKNPTALRHRFDIYLGFKNHLQIDLTSMKLLPELLHVDSIIAVALQDIAAVADSGHSVTIESRLSPASSGR